MATNEDQLNDGAIFTAGTDEDGNPAPSDPQLRWQNAWFHAVTGSDIHDGGVDFGTFLIRSALTITAQTVTANVHTTAAPGPIVAVEATAGTGLGPKLIGVVGPAATGQCIITKESNGTETITFNGTDAVTQCAYRQITMPQAMHDRLKETTDPA